MAVLHFIRRSLASANLRKKMALPMLRGCFRLQSTFSFNRLFLKERLVLNRLGNRRLPPCSPAAVAAAVRRYSSDQGEQKHQKVVVVGIPNPFIWFRTRIYYFLIRTYFDKEFSIEEFTEGAKQVSGRLSCRAQISSVLCVNVLLMMVCSFLQAFSHVSRLLSQCQFEALEGLVAKDVSALNTPASGTNSLGNRGEDHRK